MIRGLYITNQTHFVTIFASSDSNTDNSLYLAKIIFGGTGSSIGTVNYRRMLGGN